MNNKIKNEIVNKSKKPYYTEIFNTKWSDKELLKSTSISFIGSFVGTVILFFLGFFMVGGFNVFASYQYVLSINNTLSAFILFGVALIQMTGWVVILQGLHKMKFGVFFGVKSDSLSTKKIVIYGILLAVLLYVVPEVLVRILDLIGIADSKKVQTEFLVLSYPVFALVFFPIIGMFEEVFFRGILQNLFAKSSKIGVIGAILLSSAIFTSLHAFQYGLKVLIVVFSLSVVLGVVYAKFGSLKLNMLGHYLNNLVAVAFIILTSSSLATANNSLEDIKKTSENNTEFNIFVRSMSAIEGTDPYLYKYNPLYAINEFCDSEVKDEIYNEIIIGDNDILDNKLLEVIRSKTTKEDKEKLSKKLIFENALEKKQKYITKCNFEGITKSYKNSMIELQNDNSEESESVKSTIVSYSEKLALRIK